MQPKPTPNANPYVWQTVVRDLTERAQVGFRTYGTYLQPYNGRDALWDAYEELLDAAVYIRQAIYERDNKPDLSSWIRHKPWCKYLTENLEEVEVVECTCGLDATRNSYQAMETAVPVSEPTPPENEPQELLYKGRGLTDKHDTCDHKRGIYYCYW